MNYGYIRVSTDRQTVDNQRFEIEQFCPAQGISIDGWIEETISGTKSYTKRRLGKLLKRVRPGDIIICAELSRLGRNLYMIMEILSICMERGCKVWTIKEGYRLGDDIQSKVLAFAFGLSAEIERNLISQRTREALQYRQSQGMRLGRPAGSPTSVERSRLFPLRTQILHRLGKGESRRSIARSLHTDPKTLNRFIRKLADYE